MSNHLMKRPAGAKPTLPLTTVTVTPSHPGPQVEGRAQHPGQRTARPDQEGPRGVPFHFEKGFSRQGHFAGGAVERFGISKPAKRP